MSPSIDPQRAFRIVVGVLEEALRSSGRAAFVLSGGGPEERLLTSWLDRAELPWQSPSPDSLEVAKRLLVGVGRDGQPPVVSPQGSPPVVSPHGSPPEGDLHAEASGLAGAAMARTTGHLHLGSANKTCLLLSAHVPIQPVLPLGDLYASQVRSLAGSCTLPPCLQDAPAEILEGVDAGLKAYLEDGFHRHEALAGLPEAMHRKILDALAVARMAWHPIPLIPKLSKATLGLDLDL
jgi:hypothetical protein